MDLREVKKIHFIGIGGIGISAVAKLILANKKKVSGSDREETIITKDLRKQGAKIFIGHQASNLSLDTDLIVYSLAIDKKTNPEFLKAKKLKKKFLTYPQFLGLFSKNKFTIAVSGTHGKTTTTALIGLILKKACLKPFVIVGSRVKEFQGNILIGKSKYFVVEGCEYKKAFLNLKPQIIVLTNIEADHLDYYRNLKNIKKAFLEYLKKLPRNGLVIANNDDQNIRDVLKKVKVRKIWYGIENKGDYQAQNIQIEKGKTFFQVIKKRNPPSLKLWRTSPLSLKLWRTDKKTSGSVKFQGKLLGNHYLYDFLAALALADQMGVKTRVIQEVIKNFSGTWRRFEKRKNFKKFILIDDYAHHPTEIKATLRTAKLKYPHKRIIVVFQPHLYSRTKFLFNQFSQAFDLADEVIITKIYAAREKKKKGISAKKLAQAIKKYQPKTKYVASFKKIEEYLIENLKPEDVVLLIGAGNIYNLFKRKRNGS